MAVRWWCPLGHGELVWSETNGVHATCDACHGFAITIWLLGEMLVEGAASAIWRASEHAAPGTLACPECRRLVPAVPVRPDSSQGPDIPVCRTCELVWIDAKAVPVLPVLPALAASVGVTSPDPTHCDNCGARAEDDGNGGCRYCHTPLPRRQVDVVAPWLAERAAQADLDRRQDPGEFVENVIQAESTSNRPFRWP